MTTFTASEVVAKLRERFASGNDVPVPDVRLTRAEFDVIADRLEADDKAVPVTWVNPDDLHNPNFVGINAVKIGHEGLGKHYTLPLYTHPSDTERLAEALRAKIRRLRNTPKGEFQLAASIFADDLERILAAHSAQAQPPAASVTDEMVERARSAFVQADDGSTGITDAIRAALLAAHAAHTPWTEGEKAHFKAAAELVARREQGANNPLKGWIFDKVNMGRGDERYICTPDGANATTVRNESTSDHRERLLWLIAAAMAKESGNG